MKSSQSRAGALAETGVNIAVGLGIQMAANVIVLPWFGMHPTLGDIFGIAGIMTVVSIARSYALRRLFEARRVKSAPPYFHYITEEIGAERLRQINGEGYDPAHDDELANGEIACGAAAYAWSGSLHGTARIKHIVDTDHLIAHLWPFVAQHFKPTRPRRDLIKAAAMLVAEIGRLDRRAGKAAPQ